MEFMKHLFDDYANYKLENGYIIEELKNIKSPIYYKIEPVVICLDYFYEKALNGENLDIDEINLFEDGYNYLFERAIYLIALNENYFSNDINLMNKFSKSVILLLQISDYEDEIFFDDIENKEVEKTIIGLDEEVIKYIESGDDAPDELAIVVREKYERALLELDKDEYSVIDIFFQVAEELNILNIDYTEYEV